MHIDSGTQWVFFSASDEKRHLCDLLWCAYCVSKKWGKKFDDFHFFVDNSKADITNTIASRFSNVNANVHGTQDFLRLPTFISKVQTCSVIVSGHGSTDGLTYDNAGFIIKVAQFLDSIRKVIGLEFCWIVYGQCFSGLFTYTDCNKNRKQAPNEPELVQMGATEFNITGSAGIDLSSHLGGAVAGKSINLFLYFLGCFLNQPVDVDGDGSINISDCYRFCSIQQSDQDRYEKVTKLKDFQSLFIKSSADLKNAEKELEKAKKKNDKARISKYEGKIKDLNSKFQFHANLLTGNFKPWLLNASTAQKVTFK